MPNWKRRLIFWKWMQLIPLIILIGGLWVGAQVAVEVPDYPAGVLMGLTAIGMAVGAGCFIDEKIAAARFYGGF